MSKLLLLVEFLDRIAAFHSKDEKKKKKQEEKRLYQEVEL